MDLKDFIKENYEEFNSEEPSAKHFENFEKRLKKHSRQKRKQVIFNLLATAAVLAALAIASVFFENSKKNDPQIACVMSGEVLETKNYYRSILNAEIEKVEHLLEKAEPEIRREIMNDMKEITGNSETFCDSSDDGIAIMVQYYQTQIQSLQNISENLDINNNNNAN